MIGAIRILTGFQADDIVKGGEEREDIGLIEFVNMMLQLFSRCYHCTCCLQGGIHPYFIHTHTSFT